MCVEIISCIEKCIDIAFNFKKEAKISLLRCSFYECEDNDGESLCGVRCNIYNNGVIENINVDSGILTIKHRIRRHHKRIYNSTSVYLDTCKGIVNVNKHKNEEIFFNILDAYKNDEYGAEVLKRTVDVASKYFHGFRPWEKIYKVTLTLSTDAGDIKCVLPRSEIINFEHSMLNFTEFEIRKSKILKILKKIVRVFKK